VWLLGSDTKKIHYETAALVMFMPYKRIPPGARRKVLEALAQGASISGAARIAGVARATIYRWMEKSARFAQQVADAYEEGTDHLEDVVLRMALEGNTQAAIFLLKGRRPQKWRERVQVEHTAAEDFLRDFGNIIQELERAAACPPETNANERAGGTQ